MRYPALFNLWRFRPIRRLFLLRALESPGGLLEFSQDLFEATASPGSGRYEGKVKRESDSSEFLRAVELGAISGSYQQIRIFDQLGGTLPSTPQIEGDAFVVRSNITLLAASDDIADRKFANLAIGNFLFSFSQSTYFDNRPDVKLAGVLKKV